MPPQIAKFGQYVKITIKDSKRAELFVSDSFRIDFDILNTAGWTRAKFSIFNVDPEEIGNLISSGHYVTVDVSLHGGELVTITEDMYISNVLHEASVPDSVLNLYCKSGIKNTILDYNIDIDVHAPTLEKIVKEILAAAKFKGEVKFKLFPEFPVNYLKFKDLRSSTKQRGTVGACLRKLGYYHNFNVYTEDNSVVIAYKPEVSNVLGTTYFSGKDDVVLTTDNMRSNPKLGVSSISIKSNLDVNITPGRIVDVSKILTAGTDVDDETLFQAQGLLTKNVAGIPKYQVITTQHRGSNWSGVWETIASGFAPTTGNNMPTQTWFK